MYRIVFVFLFFISAFSYGQEIIIKNYESDELKDVRTLKIHLPKSYSKDSIGNYPLTIVLDSEKLFDLYVANSSLFEKKDKVPEQIIVGVHISKTKYKDVGFIKENSLPTESSSQFYRFLRDELLPYIEDNFKTSPFLSIVGEGLAGNFITYFLKEKEPIFNSYIVINPMFGQDIVSLMSSYYLKRYEARDNTFYFYVSDGPQNNSKKQERINGLGFFFKKNTIKNFHFKSDSLTRSPSNLSAISEAIPRGLSAVFEKYSAISEEEFNKNIKDLSPPDAILYLENKYLDIEFLFGTAIKIRQKDIFAIEGIIIDKENGDYLKDFGEMILKLYPASEMGNYYLGKYYESGKLYKKALNQYRTGYGKMNPSDPRAEQFYINIERLLSR